MSRLNELMEEIRGESLSESVFGVQGAKNQLTDMVWRVKKILDDIDKLDFPYSDEAETALKAITKVHVVLGDVGRAVFFEARGDKRRAQDAVAQIKHKLPKL